MPSLRVSVPVTLLVFVLSASIAAQQTPTTVLVADPGAGDAFGRFLDVTSEYLVLGDYVEAKVFVHEKTNGWGLTQTLTGDMADDFGHQIALSDDHLAVGAISRQVVGGAASGAVFAYQRDASGQWAGQQELFQASLANGARFSHAIDLEGDTMVVGADGAGRAFVYDWNGTAWVLNLELVPTTSGGLFGFDVSLSGNWLAIGQPDYAQGRVVLYQRSGSTWTYSATIPGPGGSSRFGSAISLDGDRLAIGTDTEGLVQVHYFNSSQWGFEYEINPSLPNFGGSLDLRDDTLLVGDWGSSVQVYRRDGSNWESDDTLVGPSGSTVVGFGRVVAIAPDLFVVNTNTVDSGGDAVYLYSQDLAITQEPVDVVGCEGSAATLEVLVVGVPPFTYQWNRDEVPIPGATASSWSFAALDPLDAGSYTVDVTDASGDAVTSAVATVTVNPFAGAPAVSVSQGVTCGQPVTLTASTLPGFGVEWFLTDTPAPGDAIGTDFVLEVAPSLTTTYFVRVQPGGCSSAEFSSVTILVDEVPGVPATASVSEATVCYGSPVDLVAIASEPEQSIRWYSGAIGDPEAELIGTTASDEPLFVYPTTYPISTFHAKALLGDCESTQGLEVTVGFEPIPFAVLTSTDDSICVGESVTLTAELPSPLPPGSNLEIVWMTGCLDSAVELGTGPEFNAAPPEGITTYYVRLRDQFGCTGPCNTVTVTVEGPPSVTAIEGTTQFCDTISLTVSYESSNPVLLRWYRGGLLIEGATAATLEISDAGPLDAGAYTVEVENSCGTTTGPSLELVALPVVSGIAMGPAEELSTRGMQEVTFDGSGLDDSTVVTVTSVHGTAEAEVVGFTADPDGTGTITVVMPAMAPGCDCSEHLVLPVEVSFQTDCGTAVEVINMEYAISRFDLHQVKSQSGPALTLEEVQGVLSSAASGDCIVFSRVGFAPDHPGPLVLEGKSRVTLTGVNDVAVSALAAVIPTPTLAVSACDDSVCVSNLGFVHGDSGLEISEGSSVTVDSCRFNKNDATALRGGGVTIEGGSSVTLIRCAVYNNTTTGSGGGVRVTGARAELVDCDIYGNVAGVDGGGVFIDSAMPCQIRDSRILDNGGMSSDPTTVVARGGGVAWTGPLGDFAPGSVVENSTIAGNVASDAGGGVFFDRYVAPDILGSDFDSNETVGCDSRGGGLSVAENNLILFNVCGNIFRGNVSQVGGAVALLDKNILYFEHNLVFCNSTVQLCEPTDPPSPLPPHYAAGLLLDGAEPAVWNNTVWSNSGASLSDQSGGLHHQGVDGNDLSIRDNIFVDNEGWQAYGQLPGELFSYNLGWSAVGSAPFFDSALNPEDSIYANPMFANATCAPLDPWGDFALDDASPAIGSASGENSTPDLGAIPSVGNLPPCVFVSTDCNDNGIPDSVEIGLDPGLDLDGDGVLDECTGSLDTFRRGDANNDDAFDIADAIFMLDLLFASGTALACADAGDSNDDGAHDIADAITILQSLFAQAGLPPSPGPSVCGSDPTADSLDCAATCP